MKILVVCSGGLDSVTLAYKAAREQTLAGLITFNYGQRHVREIDCAAAAARALRTCHDVIDISGVGAALTGSALTDNVPVPDGHYAEDTMKITIVPNRNAIMLSIAYGIAVSKGANAVGAAFHGGDHFIYPDCRPDFVRGFEAMQKYALESVADIKLYTPFLNRTKAEIVAEGVRLHVPFAETWSCYKGGNMHCGRCGTCVERREAFHIANVPDPTIYDDPTYWVEVVKIKNNR